ASLTRRSVFVHLWRELSQAERLKCEVAIVVMDVDGFKTINDTYGHNVGDHALREVASALQTMLRPYDLCVRYAGDEFIVVLADCSREEAEIKRGELQARIAEIQLEVRAGKRLRLGASAGAAVFPEDGSTYEQLLAAADHLMYRDKAIRRGLITMPSGAPAPEFLPDILEPAGHAPAAVPLAQIPMPWCSSVVVAGRVLQIIDGRCRVDSVRGQAAPRRVLGLRTRDVGHGRALSRSARLRSAAANRAARAAVQRSVLESWVVG